MRHRCWIVRRGDKQLQIKKGLPQSLKGYDSNGYSLFSCGNYCMKCTSVPPSGEIPVNDIPQFKLPTSNEKKSYISTETNQSYQSISQEGKDHE